MNNKGVILQPFVDALLPNLLRRLLLRLHKPMVKIHLAPHARGRFALADRLIQLIMALPMADGQDGEGLRVAGSEGR